MEHLQLISGSFLEIDELAFRFDSVFFCESGTTLFLIFKITLHSFMEHLVERICNNEKIVIIYNSFVQDSELIPHALINLESIRVLHPSHIFLFEWSKLLEAQDDNNSYENKNCAVCLQECSLILLIDLDILMNGDKLCNSSLLLLQNLHANHTIFCLHSENIMKYNISERVNNLKSIESSRDISTILQYLNHFRLAEKAIHMVG